MRQLNGGETFTDVSPGKTVTSTRLNNHVDGATLLNGAVIDQNDVGTRAGNVLPLGADRVLLGDSTQPDSALPLSVRVDALLLQAQRDGTQRWGGTAGGTANALTLATSPASAGAYVSGETIRFKTGAAANTGAVTLNLDGRGVVNLYSIAVAALVAGDLPANAAIEAVYDGTQFQLVTVALFTKQVDSLRVAEKLRGDCQQYATAGGTANAITMAPVDSSGAATFTALYDGMVVRFKAASTNTGAVTLAVNGQGTPALVSATGVALLAGAIATGQVITAVYDLANTRWVATSILNAALAFVSTLNNVPAASGVLPVAHGLTVIPSHVRVVLVQNNASAQSGYNLNDEVNLDGVNNSSNNQLTFAISADATNITIVRSNAGGVVQLIPKNGGAYANLTEANWKLKVYAAA